MGLLMHLESTLRMTAHDLTAEILLQLWLIKHPLICFYKLEVLECTRAREPIFQAISLVSLWWCSILPKRCELVLLLLERLDNVFTQIGKELKHKLAQLSPSLSRNTC